MAEPAAMQQMDYHTVGGGGNWTLYRYSSRSRPMFCQDLSKGLILIRRSLSSADSSSGQRAAGACRTGKIHEICCRHPSSGSMLNGIVESEKSCGH